MKLRNKRTGEIIEFDAIFPVKDVSGDSVAHLEYDSLAGLNEEWEDCEGSKMSYFINWFGEASELSGYISDSEIEKLKQIGNYFESKEEAEKAVEKLKAVKRLKDKGFRFKTYMRNPQGTYDCFAIWEDNIPPSSSDIAKDLNLLFSGGEE